MTNSGRPAHLQCLTLDISRAVPGDPERPHRRGHGDGHVHRAELLLRQAPPEDRPRRPHARWTCRSSRPAARTARTSGRPAVKVRDLDGGEPEVIVDLFTRRRALLLDHAHPPLGRRGEPVPLEARVLGELRLEARRPRPRRAARALRLRRALPLHVHRVRLLGRAAADLDYRQGKLVDVTRKFPAEIRKNAAYALKQFVHLKKAPNGFDPRAFVAVYVADQYLLGRPDLAKKALDDALAKGILYRGKAYLGTPAGAALRRAAEQGPAHVGLHHAERDRRPPRGRAPDDHPSDSRGGLRGVAGRRAARRHPLARPARARARSPAPRGTRSRSSSGGSTSCRARPA